MLNEQAARYGIPLGGARIDLPAVVKALHDFLAANAQKLARDEDDLLAGGGSPALERYREGARETGPAGAAGAPKSAAAAKRGPGSWGRIAAVLRAAGDALQRQFGAAAVEILYEALDDAQRELDQSLGEAGSGEQDNR